jgi:hypothetical protein
MMVDVALKIVAIVDVELNQDVNTDVISGSVTVSVETVVVWISAFALLH